MVGGGVAGALGFVLSGATFVEGLAGAEEIGPWIYYLKFFQRYAQFPGLTDVVGSVMNSVYLNWPMRVSDMVTH